MSYRRLQPRIPKIAVTTVVPNGKKLKRWVSLKPPQHGSVGTGMATTSALDTTAPGLSLNDAEHQVTAEDQSHYAKAKKQELSKWLSLSEQLKETACQNEAPPLSMDCCVCSQPSEPLIRCRDCGMGFTCCKTCYLTTHSTFNLFHCAEEWRVSASCLFIHLYNTRTKQFESSGMSLERIIIA